MGLLHRKRVGLVLRVFAKDGDQVDTNIIQTLRMIEAASKISIDGRFVFSDILVVVPKDDRFIDHDYGGTAAKLREATKSCQDVQVAELHHGDIFCGALNYSVAHLRCDYIAIASHGAMQYMTEANMSAMLVALEKGAVVTGLAIAELQESILAGRIANTFAIWDRVALTTVGGFDLKAEQAKKDERLTPYMRGWNPEKGEVFYPLAGVEEIIPLCRLVEQHGKCIAPITPAGTEKWIAPDPHTDPEGFARHIKKMGTKEVRQSAMATYANCDLSFLAGGVMNL